MSMRRFELIRRSAGRIPLVLFALFALFAIGAIVPTTAGAQAYGGSGSGGYGMMGGGGMMGGLEPRAEQQLTLAQSMSYIGRSTASASVDKSQNRVIFHGRRIFIAMAAVQPGFPDTTFEVAGLVDPTIEIPAGATVTLLLVNMDYGPDMDHGVVITDVPPPYPALSMMGVARALVGIRVLPPRNRDESAAAHYAAESAVFTAPETPGSYYYLCQYRDHASKGMFGRFEVR